MELILLTGYFNLKYTFVLISISSKKHGRVNDNNYYRGTVSITDDIRPEKTVGKTWLWCENIEWALHLVTKTVNFGPKKEAPKMFEVTNLSQMVD